MDKLYDNYVVLLGSEDEAIRRICMKFDIYFCETLIEASKKTSASNSRIKSYISKANLAQYSGKTFDTTIEEEKKVTITNIEDVKLQNIDISEEMVKFFGFGFKPEEYIYLQDQYKDWSTRHDCDTKTQEELFKTICICQLNILQAQTEGGQQLTNAMKTFQDLLKTANLKPKEVNEDALADQNTFGTLIKKWENERPIPEPDPEWQDIDGIVKYITVYFLGHLAKMMGIKNNYSKMYDDEMARYKVEKPQYKDDVDGELLFDSVFGGNKNDAE